MAYDSGTFGAGAFGADFYSAALIDGAVTMVAAAGAPFKGGASRPAGRAAPATGTLVPIGFRVQPGVRPAAGAGTLTPIGLRARNGLVLIPGVAVTSFSGGVLAPPAARFSHALGSFSARYVRARPAAASIAGTGAMPPATARVSRGGMRVAANRSTAVCAAGRRRQGQRIGIAVAGTSYGAAHSVSVARVADARSSAAFGGSVLWEHPAATVGAWVPLLAKGLTGNG